MELLRPSVPSKTQLSSTFSILSPTASLTNLTKKTRYKFRKTHLKSLPNPLFASNSQLPTCKNSRITARFGRPTYRRNSLRKKLTHDLQVRQIPRKNLDPVPHFVDNESTESNLGSTGLEQGIEKLGSGEIDSELSNKQFGESVLWNRLEGWVEQYKKDTEFWGIGSNPIFTVYQDSNGIIERVLVNEDEILKRSGVNPLYFREEKEVEDFENVNSKISHARFLARELECGKDVLPKHSSVAKFVVPGENSGWVSRVKSISIPPNLLPKVSKVGVAVVCGFLLVWVIKKWFTLGGNETEVTRFEKEMLKRKIKSRMEREELEKGSVEVVEGPSEPATVFMERPQLDKEVLLNSIKGLNDKLDVARKPNTASLGMDAKIQEIQIMARRARKIERGEGPPVEEGESGQQSLNQLPVMEKDADEEPADLVKGDELEIKASDKLPPIEIDTLEEQVDAHMNLINNDPNEYSAKPSVVNGFMKTDTLANRELEGSDGTFTSESSSEENEDLEPHSVSSGIVIDDNKSHTHSSVDSHDSSKLSDSTKGVQSSDVSSGQLRTSKNMPVRRKPKIILSVREAREYLSQKHDQQPQVSHIPATATATNEGTDMSQQLAEDGNAPESSRADRILDPSHAASICEPHSVKENESLSADVDGMYEEAQSRLMQNRPGLDGAEVSTDEIFKPSISSEISDTVPCENAFHDARWEEKGFLPTEQSVNKVDNLDELPEPANLGEESDIVPVRHASHDTSNSNEASKFFGDDSLSGAILEEKAYYEAEKCLDKVDETNEVHNPINPNETSVPVPGANDLHTGSEENAFLPIEIEDHKDFQKNKIDAQLPTADTSEGSENGRRNIDEGFSADKEKWLEKNFHEMEPIMKKIGTGFSNNYKVAREKVNKEVDMGLDFMKLRSIKDNMEFEWMQDDKLREIVFRVRENELTGRDPFHNMDPKDKVAFFEGLEGIAEKENEKLSTLHTWLHSNIENVDYGADGISLYDPPEKVIPRWKGPPIDKIPDFLTNPAELQEVASFLQKTDESPEQDKTEVSQKASTSNSRSEKVAKVSKTVIETSDGSIKPAKKSGKEYWQHTKKWSRGFVESYNAESDPEVKSVMKDMGKDLDRWITEKEVQEAADLMEKIPQRGKEYIEKKLTKLKREMELFGPAAVVSKYREYAEQKEEDYLWWLDLPYVLCIELYTYEGEDQRVGFYSLEMAADLELDPKPHHVVAFEDPSDCKNFCYIIQAHLEMLGSGKAFVVAQPPKDAFRQAKANGFGVTVIRKRELQLNVDQPLEEVEEAITEIGSKMYHDKITRDRSVDINSLMKGVFGISKPSNKRRRKKRARKKPSKP